MSPSPWKRILAFALDYLIVAAYMAVVSLLTWAVSHTAAGPALAGLFADPLAAQITIVATVTLPVVLCFALLESSPRQATWGKWQMHLRVVSVDGGRPGRGRALVRSLVKFLPWELAHTCLWRVPGWPLDPQEPPWPVYAGFGLVWLLALVYLAGLFVGEKRQTLYDRLARTRVLSAQAGTRGDFRP